MRPGPPRRALARVLVCASALPGCTSGGADPPPHLVLITVDTLRADRLEAYGHDRPTAPRIAELAAEGLLFERAVAQAPWTLPSVASIHTSLYPSQHGADSAESLLGAEVTTLAEVLGGAGYRTAGVSSHVFASSRHGLDRGFEVFDEAHLADHEDVTSEALTTSGLKLFAADDGRPVFLWVHYFDPHFSFVRHPEYGFADDYAGPLPPVLDYARLGGLVGRVQLDEPDRSYVLDVYDEEIRHTDRWIGALIDGVRAAAGGRPVVFLVTADHGEYFQERGRYGHGRDVYGELVDVPLILAGELPVELRGQRTSAFVELVDVPATLADLARVPEHPFQGRSLVDPQTLGELRPVFTEGSSAWRDHKKRAVIVDPWKLIHNIDRDEMELYDLRNDPDELRDLESDPRAAQVREELSRLLERFAEQSRGAGALQLDLSESERQHLRALGYVEGE